MSARAEPVGSRNSEYSNWSKMETAVYIDNVTTHTQVVGKPLFLTVQQASVETVSATSEYASNSAAGRSPARSVLIPNSVGRETGSVCSSCHIFPWLAKS
jgi:hypothetical protein